MGNLLKNILLIASILPVILVHISDCARILCVYTVPFKSHQSVLHKITEAVANEGHEIVVLTPIPHEKQFKNVKEILLSNSEELWDKHYEINMRDHKSFTVDPLTFMEKVVIKTTYPIFQSQMNNMEVQKLIRDKSQKFDLIIIESGTPVPLVLSAVFDAPVIMVQTFLGYAREYYNMGAVSDPIYFPDLNQEPTAKSSLWNKLYSIYTRIKFELLDVEAENAEDDMIKRNFGKNSPSSRELWQRVQMTFLCVHHVWDDNRPVPPSILYLGALHLKKPVDLSGDLKNFVDRSINGIIYMSFGSKLQPSDLPSETIHTILKVFAALPYDIIWKYNGTLPFIPKNVRLESWLPQNDLLHHPNIKVFITHAGLQSTDEAISARVPMIALPIFGDQSINSYKYEKHGIGVKLNLDTLNEDEFKRTIMDVAVNQRYRDNIKRLANLMEMERSGSVKNAMKWVNFISKYGSVNLKPVTVELSFMDYYITSSIDVIITLFLISAFILALLILIVTKGVKKHISKLKFKKD